MYQNQKVVRHKKFMADFSRKTKLEAIQEASIEYSVPDYQMAEYNGEIGISISVSDAEEEKQQIDNESKDFKITKGLGRDIGDEAGQRPEGNEVHELND